MGQDTLDSAYSWARLGIAMLIGTIGSVGMWSVVVVLPVVQADFGVARADASLPFTLAMVGFALGNVVMGRMADRFGIVFPILCGGLSLGIGYVCAALSPNLWLFAAAHALLGFGAVTTFGPLIADTSHWFLRRRGIAVALCASGNYLGGTIWPFIVQHFSTTAGWRPTHIGIGLVCVIGILPLAQALRRRPNLQEAAPLAAGSLAPGRRGDLGLTPNALTALLCVAGVACCVAMSMPQVHIVAYCGDLGYGVARGAEMLSLMMGFGIISRVGSGFIADRFGGLATLMLGSVLQSVALGLYLGFDGLTSLYVISALFGLFQGGIVPSYAIIVREYFSPQEAGIRLGVVIMATVVGMAFGGWMSGFIFDLTGSYRVAFAHGIAWNLLNVSIALWLLLRSSRRLAVA